MAFIRIADCAGSGNDATGDGRLGSSSPRRRGWGWAAVAMLWLFMGTETAFAQFDLQPLPANYDSTLITNTDSAIAGTTFAGWADTALVNNGNPAVLSASFMLQECYGGGIISDLKSSLGNQVSWVGASASTATQPSWGPGDPTTKMDYWTQKLVPQLAMPPQPVLTSVTNAAKTDVAGFNGTKQELGQVYAIGAPVQGTTFNFNLNEGKNGATNEVAVLWAGDPNGQRHLNDINNIYNTLTNLWKNQNFQIYVLYGSAIPANAAWNNFVSTAPAGVTESVTAMAATSANLQKLLTQTLAPGGASAMTSTTQFTFYASDHGGFDNRINPGIVTVPSFSLDKESYSLTAAQIASIVAGDSPATLTVTYYGLGQDVRVFWGATTLLGTLTAGGTAAAPLSVTFDIPDAALVQNNTIFIDNRGDSSSFVVTSKEFFSGADADIFAIPEPSSWILAGLGALGVVAVTCVRRSRAGGKRVVLLA